MRNDFFTGRTKRSIRVFIADSRSVVRLALTELIDHERGFAVCGHAEDTSAALREIGAAKPDIAIIDLAIDPDAKGTDIVRKFRAAYPELPILGVSTHPAAVYGAEILQAGANGYIVTDQSADRVIDSIYRVLGADGQATRLAGNTA